MPSVTLSNYDAADLARLLVPDLRLAHVRSQTTSCGRTATPAANRSLGGLQVTIEPASGWSLSLNRVVQFGGGARGSGSFSQLLKALINPSKYSNTPASNADAANQEALDYQ